MPQLSISSLSIWFCNLKYLAATENYLSWSVTDISSSFANMIQHAGQVLETVVSFHSSVKIKKKIFQTCFLFDCWKGHLQYNIWAFSTHISKSWQKHSYILNQSWSFKKWHMLLRFEESPDQKLQKIIYIWMLSFFTQQIQVAIHNYLNCIH